MSELIIIVFFYFGVEYGPMVQVGATRGPPSLCRDSQKETQGERGLAPSTGLSQQIFAEPTYPGDDLSREVFGVMGLPLDALDLDGLLERIDSAVVARAPFLLSTPNVNFLMMSRSNKVFRESLLISDLCPIDGMPLVWMARSMGLPLRERLSGSDIFDALRSRSSLGRRLKVFMFGGADGVADKLRETLNQQSGGLTCVGTLNPGFGSIEEMSTDPILDSINASEADLLTVFMSAEKAQGWLLRNHNRLTIPFRAQFGATINLQAGSVKRAPAFVQRLGFEWLWRIKEEPYLWRRYWKDGLGLLKLSLTCLLPLLMGNLRQRSRLTERLKIQRKEDAQSVWIKLSGSAIASQTDAAINCFRNALESRKAIEIEMSAIRHIDPRFFGLLLMLRKQSKRNGSGLTLINPTAQIRKSFRLNGFEFLLNAES
jgi:N-acetylglucosaminyldiphosphoundecaprenol N-acetyl-beta-D-mannosaminyltransferase